MHDFVIEAGATVTPAQFDGEFVPIAQGNNCPQRSFDPRRASWIEIVDATFESHSGETDVTLQATVEDGSDATMVMAITGNLNCFPHAPDISKAVPGPLPDLAARKWPAFQAKVPVTVAFVVKESVLRRIAPPVGFKPIPKSVQVRILLTISGSLKE